MITLSDFIWTDIKNERLGLQRPNNIRLNKVQYSNDKNDLQYECLNNERIMKSRYFEKEAQYAMRLL